MAAFVTPSSTVPLSLTVHASKRQTSNTPIPSRVSSDSRSKFSSTSQHKHAMQEEKTAGQERCMSLEAMQTLNSLRINNQFCDTTILLDDGKEIPTHRAILSASSSYFRAAFTSPLNSANSGVVRVPGVSSEMMRILLDYVYLRQLDLTEENVHSVLVTADYLSILGALKLCCNYLVSILSPTNAIGTLIFARSHFCVQLAEDAWVYIMKHFKEIIETSEEILQLPFEEFFQIMDCDMLNVQREEMAWEMALQWIDHDPEQRMRHTLLLLKAIRLGLLDTLYFMEKVRDHPYVSSCELCRPVVIEALRFLYDLDRLTLTNGSIPTPPMAIPRFPHEILFAIGGWSGGSPSRSVETYDVRANRWTNNVEIELPRARAYHGTEVVKRKIYLIGGFNGMEYYNSCCRLDPVRRLWKDISPMHSKRCYVSTAVVGCTIYAMGGYDGAHRQNSAEKYNHKSNQWTMIASMNSQRSDACACSLQGKVYITGGYNGTECMSSAEVYDPDVNQWTHVRTMRSRRSGVSCIAYRDMVYVLGGFNGLTRMCSGEKFNPKTNAWLHIPDMHNPRSNFATTVLDDKLFVVGGFNGTTTMSSVESFQEGTDDWTEVDDLCTLRSAVSASVIENIPNIIDYIYPHRDRLLEEKRTRELARERREAEPAPHQPNFNFHPFNNRGQAPPHVQPNPVIPPPLPPDPDPDENENLL